jgi:hypothetical protein
MARRRGDASSARGQEHIEQAAALFCLFRTWSEQVLDRSTGWSELDRSWSKQAGVRHASVSSAQAGGRQAGKRAQEQAFHSLLQYNLAVEERIRIPMCCAGAAAGLAAAD